MFDAVAIEKCASYEADNINKALDGVLDSIDALNFIKEGMTIGIKANLVSAIEPQKAATTHPALLRSLCARIVEKGASVVIGDSPGGLYTSVFVRNVYKT